MPIVLSIVIFMPQFASTEKVRFALPGNSMGYPPFFISIQGVFFKHQRREIKVIPMQPDIAHNALLSSKVDYRVLEEVRRELAR